MCRAARWGLPAVAGTAAGVTHALAPLLLLSTHCQDYSAHSQSLWSPFLPISFIHIQLLMKKRKKKKKNKLCRLFLPAYNNCAWWGNLKTTFWPHFGKRTFIMLYLRVYSIKIRGRERFVLFIYLFIFCLVTSPTFCNWTLSAQFVCQRKILFLLFLLGQQTQIECCVISSSCATLQ